MTMNRALRYALALAVMAPTSGIAHAHGARHIGNHGWHFGGAIPGSGHHGIHLFGGRSPGGCRRCHRR